MPRYSFHPTYCRYSIFDRRKFPLIWRIKRMPKTKTLKVSIFRSPANEQFYFHIRAKNGKIVCASESYKSKQACLKTVRMLMEAKLIFKA